MNLTQEIVEQYVGGQLEVQNRGEDYVYRGEIAKISITGEGDSRSLNVELTWMAQLRGGEWYEDMGLTYTASLLIYYPSVIGGRRISLHSPIVGEMVVLFPPDGSKLDHERVKKNEEIPQDI